MPKPLLPDPEDIISGLDGARRRRLARTLVEQAAEQDRLAAFEAAGGLDRPAYALSPGMEAFDIAPLVADYQTHAQALAALMAPEGTASGYRAGNGYFDTPDAEALYLMIRRFAPKRVIEVGCGNSTRITRQAIIDGGLNTQLTAVDPWPRADIADVVDRFEQATLESVDPALFAGLQAGDVLFIDSSHQVRMSNDVAHLFCRIIPALAPGVVIHVHDVFLPYEYPKRFFYDCPSWGEQYMLHALLQGGGYEILWPGYLLQRGRADAVAALPFLSKGRAQSFWMRKR
ncbi:class I SAM-dependent methyltransferase [Antarcticimicrobium sediminis]|uniref:Class I SAM-dependent methyltransferase n=1 Tax=Antarcticimicrobium sediminis TaxID=2546227 RepID=A0A4R5EZ39_9RHOB|nr:class I SAM-dependent methyltransferase [Antarcticimicrobium sediminis]TDE40369.1 class I SAM-dependent methyltransferase [Antarcticimicrobium sediminis]